MIEITLCNALVRCGGLRPFDPGIDRVSRGRRIRQGDQHDSLLTYADAKVKALCQEKCKPLAIYQAKDDLFPGV